MKNTAFKILTVVLSLALLTGVAHAATFADLKKAATEARETLVTLLKEPSKRGEDQQKLVRDTANKVDELLKGMKAPAGKEAKFEEMVKAWNDFHTTRKNELVPAILAGKQEEAEKIATGMQKERIQKVFRLCDELGGADL